MKPVTVVIPHALTTRWTQIAVSSLLGHQNDTPFDIIVINNTPGHPSIRGITETTLGNLVKVVSPTDPANTGHQLSLDQAIDLVETPWFLAWETDVRVLRDGWLDWMLSYAKDDYVAIIGWYWDAGFDDGRHYISPAGALYRTSILKRLKRECLDNPDLSVCWGRDMSKRISLASEYAQTAGKLIPMGNWGPFSECRGFGNVYPFQRDQWVPEPGNWIYNRCAMQWEVVHLPGAMVINEKIRETGIPHKYTYVGLSEKEAYFIHHWAGSVSHNWEKHTIYDFDVPKLSWWIEREHRLWNEVVPEDVRRQTIDLGLVKSMPEEYAAALSKVAQYKAG